MMPGIAGEAVREPDTEIGMHQPIESFGRLPADERSQHPVAAVRRSQAVAVNDVNPLTVNFSVHRFTGDRYPDLFREKPSDVPVVISPQINYPLPLPNQPMQRG